MGIDWTVQDDAALAAKLAPVLGEDAVYRKWWVCEAGHHEEATRIGGGGKYLCARTSPFGRQCDETTTLRSEPVAFTNPAVGWGLFERWLSDSLADVEITTHSVGFEVSLTTYPPDPDVARTRFGTTQPGLWPAVLRVWRAACEGEEPHV